MLKKIVFLTMLCLMFLSFNAFGQKIEKEEIPEPKSKEISEPKPPEPEPPKSVETPPKESSSSPPVSKPSSENHNRNQSSDNRSRSGERRRDENRDSSERSSDRRRDHKRDGKDKDDDKDDKDRRRKHRRNRDIYEPPTSPSTVYVNTAPPLLLNKNDIFYQTFESYVETNPNNYLPYFQNRSKPFSSLFKVSIVDINIGKYPFAGYGWAFYYEPQLDDLFVDLSRFGNTKFEKILFIPQPDTVATVKKKYHSYTDNEPALIEDISHFDTDEACTFNIKPLPKGNYDLILLNRFGDIVKIKFARK